MKLIVPDKEFAWYKSLISKQFIRYWRSEEKHLPEEKRHPCFCGYMMMPKSEAKGAKDELNLPGKHIETHELGICKGSIKSNKHLMPRWKKIIRKYEANLSAA